jgi:hypothetical protein
MQEVEQRARAYLRNTSTIPSAQALTNYLLRLRLWHYPAFEAYRSWSVFEPHQRRQPSELLIRQVTWDRAHDSNRLHDPLLGLQQGFHTFPKMEVRDRALDVAAFAERLDAAHSISLPLVGRSGGACLDGAMFGFEERDGSPRLEWCCDGPAEWQEFTTWAREMMRWLHETCVA